MAFIAPTDGNVESSTHLALVVIARLAVVLFFLLSGYVIAQSIDANRRRHSGRFDPTDFALARVFRIVPPMLLTIAVTVLFHAVMLFTGTVFVAWQSAERMVFHTDAAEQLLSLATLTMAGNLSGADFNGPIWSLVVEIRLYIVAGLLALAPRRPWVLLLVAAYAWAIFRPEGTSEPWVQAGMFACFAIGAAAYSLRHAGQLLPAGLALAAVFAVTCWPLDPREAHRGINDLPWLAMQVAAAATFAPVLIALGRSERFGALHWLGRGSYTLYILHFPVLQAIYFPLFNHARPLVAEHAQWTAPVAGLLAFGVCVGLGVWVERPKAQRRRVHSWLTSIIFPRKSTVESSRTLHTSGHSNLPS